LNDADNQPTGVIARFKRAIQYTPADARREVVPQCLVGVYWMPAEERA
jgi:hypothetical protein